jgi:hypothetical protein
MSGHQLGAVAGLLIALPVVVLLGTISQLSREPNAYKRLDYDARRFVLTTYCL